MKTYELTYIVSPEVTSEEAEAKIKEIESKIQGEEGKVLKQEAPSAKTLAYPINKRASGFLGVLEFQLEEEKLSVVKEYITKDKKIVRHTIIVKKPIDLREKRRTRTKPAAILETKKEIVAKTEEKETPVKKERPEGHPEKQKVELKDIEQKLDEILG